MKMSEEEMKMRGINPMARMLQPVISVYGGNYARFYSLLRKLPGDSEEIKRQLVLQYTSHRTDSLKEVSANEYKRMCERLEELVPASAIRDRLREELRRQRSICLKLMQQLGVNTTDWGRINAFCQDGRIAGKPFRDISTEELELLSRKLRSIERKGGIRQLEEPGEMAKILNIHQ